MLNKTLVLITATGATGILIGTLINPSTDWLATAKNINTTTEKLEDITSRLDLLSTLVTGMQSYNNSQGNPQSELTHEPPLQTMTSGEKVIHDNTSAASALHYDTDKLTPELKELYSELNQRIETAPYGGLTMDSLLSEMQNMPNKHKQKLMAKVTELVNNGTLDPKKFVEGTY